MAIDALAEEAATNLEEAAEVARNLNTAATKYFVVGVAVGAAVGFFYGYRWNRKKIKAEAFKESEAVIAEMRETYRRRVVAAEPKPSVEEVIEERGYAPTTHNPERVLTSMDPVGQDSVGTGWDWDTEMARRSPDHPYVIHQSEFNQDGNPYTQVAYTYYDVDDVLVDEDNRPLPHGDLVVGQDNLKWGHGADGPDVVFVRNERLEREMEISRAHLSYEEEVLGLDGNGNEPG